MGGCGAGPSACCSSSSCSSSFSSSPSAGLFTWITVRGMPQRDGSAHIPGLRPASEWFATRTASPTSTPTRPRTCSRPRAGSTLRSGCGRWRSCGASEQGPERAVRRHVAGQRPIHPHAGLADKRREGLGRHVRRGQEGAGRVRQRRQRLARPARRPVAAVCHRRAARARRRARRLPPADTGRRSTR